MTTAPGAFQPHPLAKPLQPGDITETWCPAHYDRTRHIWTGHKLICLECYPELEPESDITDEVYNARQNS